MLVGSLLLAGFADETVAFLPYGAVESIRRDVDLSYLEAGVLLALYPGIGLLATPLGVVVDLVSRRVVAAAGGVGYGVGLFLFALADGFWALFVAVVVMGVAGDAMMRAAEVALVDVAGDNLEPALARSTLLAAVGDLVGPLLLFAALGTGLGWRAAFWAAGVLLVGYGLLLASQPLPPPARQAAPPDRPDSPDSAKDSGEDSAGERSPWRVLLDVARDRRVIVAGLMVAIISAFDDTFVGFAVAFLITERDLSPAIATLAAGAGLTGGLLAAAWASRTTRRRVGVRPCAVLLLAGVVLVLLVPGTAAAVLGTAAVGAAVNLAWIVLQARYLTLRPGQAGATSAVADAVGQLAVLVPVVVGLLADNHGLTWAMLLYVAIAGLFVATADRPPPTGRSANG